MSLRSWWLRARGGRPLACPECGKELPSFTMFTLTRDYLMPNGEVTQIVEGYRKACQTCPAIYSVWRNGTFKHHARSLPLVERVQPRLEAQRPRDDDDEPQWRLPVPKERPEPA
jgi:hypothetical protein